MQDPRQITLDLAAIAGLLEFGGASKFRVNAFRRGADIVNDLGDELGALVEQGRLQEFEGIGPTLSQQIEELWNTGRSELLARLLAEAPEGVLELMQIPGLTPRRIHALHTALGIRSAVELRAACAAGRVAKVKGFGAKTEAKLLEAVQSWLTRDERPRDPLPLADALELAELVRKRLLTVTETAELAGALRRGEELVRTLEFVVTGDVERALDAISSLREVLRVDRAGRSAVMTDGVTLELHAAERADLGRALVVATGSDEHLAALRARAKERNVELERAFSEEREVYAAVGCAFVPPELREGRSELAEASERDFTDLVELADIQGMVHCHTSYSDGKNSVLEMARAAHARGMKYITITDHSPSAHYARGVALDRLKAQWDDIAAARAEVPIRILAGTESDILADGALDYPDDVIERFDVLIASIHARHRMDRAAMTERLSRAMAFPAFKIWGHALGRILNHRAPIDCDVPAVLDALARSRGAVEINADPHRLDLPPAWMPAVRERRLPFVISVDAHSTRGLDVLRYGVVMARRGGVRKSEVLNAGSAERFAASVKPV
ncbi:MAG TPA: PHP domain-containing protein [Polyangiaceae bacterium]|nr:PHP domain-containing protein [Polyangiaceae bacterium]